MPEHRRLPPACRNMSPTCRRTPSRRDSGRQHGLDPGQSENDLLLRVGGLLLGVGGPRLHVGRFRPGGPPHRNGRGAGRGGMAGKYPRREIPDSRTMAEKPHDSPRDDDARHPSRSRCSSTEQPSCVRGDVNPVSAAWGHHVVAAQDFEVVRRSGRVFSLDSHDRQARQRVRHCPWSEAGIAD